MKNIQLNFQRLCSEDYSIENVFQSSDYSWPGDWEGRALLAFCCHYEMHKQETSALHALVKLIPEKTNTQLYFGVNFDGVIVDEQQLSGHNWYLRGLLKYAELFNSDFAMQAAKSTVEHLYLPMLEWYDSYPLERDELVGDVSGDVVGVCSGWKLSSDVGCAFMCVDGLADYYERTKDCKVKAFLDKVIAIFEKVDLVKYRFQTHTTLTCTRGILRLYQVTGEAKYLEIVKRIFQIYLDYGMTLTYENYNWFGREDTWTEPCAVVDSFILAMKLYQITGDNSYLTLSRRIWFNGLQFCQRENGGAGPNSCVTVSQRSLKIAMYEASFCCTMRYAEGLLVYFHNSELFDWHDDMELVVDDLGRRFVDDKILVKSEEQWIPIFSCNTYAKDKALALKLEV